MSRNVFYNFYTRFYTNVRTSKTFIDKFSVNSCLKSPKGLCHYSVAVSIAPASRTVCRSGHIHCACAQSCFPELPGHMKTLTYPLCQRTDVAPQSSWREGRERCLFLTPLPIHPGIQTGWASLRVLSAYLPRTFRVLWHPWRPIGCSPDWSAI